MRYFVTGEQQRKSLLNALVLMFLGYIALLWVSNGLMYFHHMNLTPDSVIAYYLGSEEQFTQPRSYQGMLEVSHFHLFSMGMLIVTLTHLMLMTDFSVSLKIWLSGLIYISALADEAGGWLQRCWKSRSAIILRTKKPSSSPVWTGGGYPKPFSEQVTNVFLET